MFLQIFVFSTIVLIAHSGEPVGRPLASLLVCLALGLFQWSVARTFRRSDFVDVCWGVTSLLMISPGHWGVLVDALPGGDLPFLREAAILAPAIISRFVMLAESNGWAQAGNQLRMSLPLTCGPVWLGSAAAYWGGLGQADGRSGMATIGLISLLLIVVFPLFLRRCWGLAPVASPDLVRRLQSQHGRSLPDLLAWPVGGSIINAALLGCVPPFRYLVISPALLDSLSPSELDAVIAHEMGHLRRWHGARRLLAIILPATLVLTGRHFLLTWYEAEGLAATLLELAGPVLLSAYYFWLTPRQSKQMELEADAWAVEHLRPAHGDQAGELLTSALRKLSVAADIPLDQAKWLHPSFRERAAALAQASA
ncbi:MAG: M48 family metalloprotease [Blastopirellula sp. JB062]